MGAQAQRRNAARDRRPRHGGGAHARAPARRKLHDGRRIHRQRRRSRALHAELWAFASRRPGSLCGRRGLERYGNVLAGMVAPWPPPRPMEDPVSRSLITLKALTYGPTGGMVAAPTTSLPERIGGPRNWDYRFCWVRDATLLLLALMNAGYYEEAQCWRDWLTRAVAGRPEQLEVMYGVAGERRLTEWEVPWLPGYENSSPVRIGNAAHAQLQLDVFGEIMDTLHQGRRGGLSASEAGWDVQIALLRHLADIWPDPDHGIWEVRSEPLHFTYSKAMAWVAFDRALKSAEMFGLPGPIERWRALCGEIHRHVCKNAWDEKRNTFTRSYGSNDLDASLLLLAPIGFIKPDDPRYRGTVEAIERDLVVDGLVLRYDSL